MSLNQWRFPLLLILSHVLFAQTTVTLTTSPNPSIFGAPVSLTATVTNSTATGKVTFFDGVTILGTKPVSSGTASISTILLPAGTRKLTAYYRDDANATGTSNIATQTVIAAASQALAQNPLTLPTAQSAVVGDFNGDGKADYVFPDVIGAQWWQVDLGASASIGSIAIWNRTDCCGDRLGDYWVFVSDTPFTPLDTPATLQGRAGTFSSHQTVAPNPSTIIPAGGAQGRFVRVQLTYEGSYLSLAEVQIFGTGAQAATNLALGKAAAQSSTLQGYTTTGAASAVDGNTSGNFFDGSVTHTDLLGRVVNVVLGNGDGTFQPLVSYTTGFSPYPLNLTMSTPVAVAPVAVGDFNGDGNTDVAVATSSFVLSQNIATVSILLGNGDGTFRPPINSSAGSLAGSIAVGDFNGDGKADLVIGFLVQRTVGGSSGLNFLFGNGDGTFTAPVSVNSPGFFPPFLVADFNGDRKADLAVSLGSGPQSILIGNGDGTTQTPIGLDRGVNGTPTVAGDFNGDGKTDLAGAGGLTGNSTLILLGNGNGTFQPPPVIYPFGVPTVQGDFNGDGITDLVVANTSNNTLGILLGNGDGTFRQGLNSSPGSPLAVADFNGDGRADILTTNSIVFGAASVTFSITATGGTPQSASIGSPFALPLQVTVRNNGVLLSGATVTFSVPAAGASAVLSSSTAVTNASGVASVTATANSVAGSYVVTATYQGLTATFALTNTTFASVTATGGTPQSTPIGVAFPTALQATVKDAIGNPVSGVTVAFAAPATGASATLSSATAVSNALGVASVTAMANNIAGNYNVTASVGGLSATFALTNTSGGSSNLAQGKTATQSSTLSGYPTAVAASAVDGNTNGSFFNGSVTHTNLDTNAWWQVDLGVSATVNSIVVWPRTDCCADRLSDYWVFVSDTPFGPNDTPTTLQGRAGTFSNHQTAAPNPSTTITVAAQGRYVRVQLTGANNLSLAEVQIFGTGAPSVSNLAQGKAATQSSTLGGSATAVAASAVDGSTNGSFFNGSVTHTNLDTNAWWQVDLGASATVNSVVIWPRTDCCADRLSDYWVFVSDTPFGPADTPATLQNRPGTFSSHQTTAPNPSATIPVNAQGRYVRVQLTGANNLSLAEVQVLGTGAPSVSNLAQGKTAAQSSTLSGSATASAASAVDGNTDGSFFNGSVTHTNPDTNAWWQVDLGASAAVSSIVIWNRTDCCGTRLSDYWVFVSDTPFGAADTPATLQNRAGTFSSHQTTAPNPSTSIPFVAEGRYVRVQLTGTNNLSLAEVQVFGQ